MKLALAVILTLATGCATLKPIATSAAACSESALVNKIPSAATTVQQILSQPGINAQAALEQLAVSVGLDVVGCAVAAVVAELEAGHMAPPPAAAMVATVPPSVQLLRAYAFQAAHAGG